MLFPPLLVPPSEASVDTWYSVFGLAFACICAAAFWAKTRAAPPSSVTVVYGIASRIGPAVSAHRGGMGVKDLFLCCHNIFSVNELFTELCFRGWFRIEKEPLRAFELDHFCRCR